MDLLTQGLLGAALAQTRARPAETRLAAGVGFMAGVLADTDVFIASSSDPLLGVEYHRHFTHSVLFIPLGALLAALLAYPLLRRRLGFARLYLFALLGYCLSGFIDACTSYGTYLLWPLYDERIAWRIVAIVDPLFTLTLLAAVSIALWKRRSRAAYAGLLLCGAYLALGVVQHQRALEAAVQLAASRGHAVERLVVKPTIGNLLLWRSVYLSGERFHVDALRLAGGTRVYPGDSVSAFDLQRDAPAVPAGSELDRDIARFDDLSDGFVIRHPGRSDVLGDIRYSMFPTSAQPLWGIKVDFDAPQRHTPYLFFRDSSVQQRRQFLDMLLGK
jgi:inner membrane protein